MGTSTMVPLGEYLRSTYRPDCDWIDGEVRERNTGEGQHAAVQKFLINYLSTHEQQWHVFVLPEQRVQTSAKHYRIPDICLTRDDAIFEQIIRIPPILCIEVMSYDDRMSEIMERVEDYLGMGVVAVWIVDPRRRRAFMADVNGVEQAVERLGVTGLPIHVDLNTVFAYLDKTEARR